MPEKVLEAYREWLTSRPLDIGATTERGLLGMHTTESESNGSLMRVSPIGVWAAGDPQRAARDRARGFGAHAQEPGVHRSVRRLRGGDRGRRGRRRRARRCARPALANCSGRVREAIASGKPPEDYFTHMGWVAGLAAERVFSSSHSNFEEALISTVSAGGDTDTNAAICGALLGAALGRAAIPPRWILPVLACRSTVDAGAPRPRPAAYWPDDILELAEALLQ